MCFRRSILAALLAVALYGLGVQVAAAAAVAPFPLPGSGPPPPSAPGPVPSPLGSVTEGVNVGHTGFLADSALVPPLVKRWSVRFIAQQILAIEGRAFLVSPGGVLAVDLASGHPRWATPLSEVMGAAYDRGLVLVSTFDDLHALDARTGHEIWRRHLADTAFADEPVAEGGVVYVVHEQSGGELHAFRESDGAELWRATPVHGSRYPALDAGRVYMAGECGNAAAYDRRDGNRIWYRPTYCEGTLGTVAPSLFGDRFWVASEESTRTEMLAPPILDAGTGRLVDRCQGDGQIFVDGRVVVRYGGNALRALDEGRPGRILWRRHVGAAALIAVGHNVYAARGGALQALDAKRGATRWQTRLPGGVYPDDRPITLAAAPGTLLAGGGGRVIAFRSAGRHRHR